MSLAKLLEAIPYLAVHDLAVDASKTEVQVRMKLKPELSNHVGILHAGAIYTAAETAAGIAAWRVVEGGRAVVLLRSSEVKYTRRAESSLLAIAKVSSTVAESTRALFDDKGRADAVAEVRCTDEQGDTVFEGRFDYALRSRKA